MALTLLVSLWLSAWAPGDAWSELALDPSISAQTLESLRQRLDPTASVWMRWWHWLTAAGRGDFGYSFQYHLPVLPLVVQRLPSTLCLGASGLCGAWTGGLLLALAVVYSAARQPGYGGQHAWRRAGVINWVRRQIRTGTVSFASLLAAFPLALMCLLALQWAPARWLPSPDQPAPLFLPALLLTLAFLPIVFLQALEALEAVAAQPFILALRALGYSRARIVWRHLLPHAADALLPLAAMTFAQFLMDALVVEVLLGRAGLGSLALAAATHHDTPVVAFLVLLVSLLVVAGNLLADLALYALQPRARLAATGEPIKVLSMTGGQQ